MQEFSLKSGDVAMYYLRNGAYEPVVVCDKHEIDEGEDEEYLIETLDCLKKRTVVNRKRLYTTEDLDNLFENLRDTYDKEQSQFEVGQRVVCDRWLYQSRNVPAIIVSKVFDEDYQTEELFEIVFLSSHESESVIIGKTTVNRHMLMTVQEFKKRNGSNCHNLTDATFNILESTIKSDILE